MAQLLSLRGISKQFPGLMALDGVNLSLSAGEVLALVGENGAGKSTIVKILTGIHQADAGEIEIGGDRAIFTSPRDARTAGISVIHQETNMFDDLSVAENVFAGALPQTPFGGRIDWSRMRRETAGLLSRLDTKIDPKIPLRDLSVAQKHIIAIAKALSHDAKIVIMDEPTAALSRHETGDLFQIIRQLKAAGKGIIFISHKFEEIFEIADRYTVLRDGRSVGSGDIAAVTQSQLVSMMVGRPVETVFPKAAVPIGETVLKVEGLSRDPEFADVSFDLRQGEILGVYGLVGAGRTELTQCLFGITKPDAGTVNLRGTPIRIVSPAQSIAHGIAYVPEDRQLHGAILPMSVTENLTLPTLERAVGGLLLNSGRETEVTRRYCARLAVKTASLDQQVADLSGGNQQKVVIAKWLATHPAIIILDEPTKGIDIGSKAAVHEFMSTLVREGLAIILVSSEIPEILGMSDRVIVMHRGRVVRRFAPGEATAEALVVAATGSNVEPETPSLERGTGHDTSKRPVSVKAKPAARFFDIPALLRHRELVLIGLILALLFAIGARAPVFLTPSSLNDVLSDTAILVIMAIGQMMVILIRGIDLSVSANLAFSGMCVALLSKHGIDIGPGSSLALAAGIGATLGAINGALIAGIGLPSIVVTLATMSVFRGLIYVMTDGASVSQNEMYPAFLNFPLREFLGLTYLVWGALIVCSAAFLVLRFTKFGRGLYAIGSNPLAARYAGLRPERAEFAVYTISGLLAGACGYLWVARYAIAFTEVAIGLELGVIAACVVGGVSIAGGIGTVGGCILGALFLQVISNSLPVLRISPFWQMAISGLVILGAVIVNARAEVKKGKQILRE